MMGRALDWQALPVIVELLGVEDVEMLAQELIAIRSHVERLQEVKRRG